MQPFYSSSDLFVFGVKSRITKQRDIKKHKISNIINISVIFKKEYWKRIEWKVQNPHRVFTNLKAGVKIC